MLLSEFRNALRAAGDLPLVFVLPDGEKVPPHFHITEVGRVTKDFIDCGGTVRSTAACVLQVWVAGDVQHRLSADKLGKIIDKGASLFSDDLPVEVEYDSVTVSQFPLAGTTLCDGNLQLQLTTKHTACLAPDRCGLPVLNGECATTGCC